MKYHYERAQISVKLKNKTYDIAFYAYYAKSFHSRFWGLMRVKDIKDGQAFILEKCRSIHTCFMRMKIDVLFVDENYQIVRAALNVSPWKFLIAKKPAAHAIELKAGTIRKYLFE